MTADQFDQHLLDILPVRINRTLDCIDRCLVNAQLSDTAYWLARADLYIAALHTYESLLAALLSGDLVPLPAKRGGVRGGELAPIHLLRYNNHAYILHLETSLSLPLSGSFQFVLQFIY